MYNVRIPQQISSSCKFRNMHRIIRIYKAIILHAWKQFAASTIGCKTVTALACCCLNIVANLFVLTEDFIRGLHWSNYRCSPVRDWDIPAIRRRPIYIDCIRIYYNTRLLSKPFNCIYIPGSVMHTCKIANPDSDFFPFYMHVWHLRRYLAIILLFLNL